MKLFKKLDDELKTNIPEGVHAPYYYRYLGIMDDTEAPAPIMRANIVYSLFTRCTPFVYDNDIIAGNEKSLYTTAPENVLAEAKTVNDRLGDRTFITNKDHFAPNYEHLLAVGVTGLLKEIDNSKKKHRDDNEKCLMLSAMEKTLQAFIIMIKKYAEAAKQNGNTFVYDNCKAIAEDAPKTFAQALQLVWFCHIAFKMEERNAMALGRMDRYLYPFYKKGDFTDEQVLQLLENTFIKIKRDDVINICIGGTDPDGSCTVNELSYLILKAVGNCNVPGPNLSARIGKNTPDEFLDECLKVIGTGLGYPALMNDDINIAALKKYGYAEKDVYNYCFVGCIENFIAGKQPPWSDGRFDTPAYFDCVDINGVNDMQGFMARFEEQLSLAVKKYVLKFKSRNDAINPKFYPQPFLSCFCDDCIGRGLDINDGGAIYPSVHGAGLMGVATTADSLAAIEQVVFTDKKATLSELYRAIDADFEGYGELRQLLLDAPKYGNNNDFVDKYAVWFLDFLASEFLKYKTHDGGGIYVAMATNISNIHAGAIIKATPDGRLGGKPLSDAASPTYGKDTKGATVTVNSVSKPDYSKVACGTVINQKFSPEMFGDSKRHKLLALIKTYFKKGGQEMQINATSRKVLQDAIDHPENYRDLVVRVSGFSAYYVTLDPRVQLDILNRTQQE